MRRFCAFIRNHRWCKVILMGTAMVFPFACWRYLNGGQTGDVANYMWIGFYSCLFVCITLRNLLLKTGAIALNMGCFLVLMCLFTLRGNQMIPAMVMKMLFPFWPNPWLNG